jgi:dTDP-3-amino-3,4,6-trideoxy-alpha-D-glucose transaminase
MRIRFADLDRGTAPLRQELAAAAERVLASGWYVLGEEGRAFERDFAAACGAAHAVGCASGTDAIELALRALDVGPGDEVVTQASTCVPTVAGIERAGATPVLCDVDPDSGVLDPASLARAVGPATRAVVPVHLYGQMADVDAVRAAAPGIPVVEDCAQAHGAELRGRRAGSLGELAAFSFYPTKNLGALGDGGAVATRNDALAERLRRVRVYGQADRYHHVERGVNSRLDELQAALLRVKLPLLDGWNARRAEIAAAYDEALAGTPVRPLGRLPDRRHAFHLYVVRAPEREAFRRGLAEVGVDTLVHYPVPIHGHPPYRELRRDLEELAAAERLAAEVVSLPLYPELTDAEVEHVARAAAAAARAPAAA